MTATTKRKKKTRKAAKNAAKKSAAKALRTKALRPKSAGAKTRGKKSARRPKVASAPAAKTAAKSAPKAKQAATAKPKSKRKPSRNGAPARRHLLVSVRRPKVPALRRPSRVRAASRRQHAKRSGAVRILPKQSIAVEIRDFAPEDAAAVNAIALAAFEQYRGEYEDWPAFAESVGAMASLADSGELIVALIDGKIAGAVAYFGPQAEKPTIFDPAWPIVRMLVVDPAARGAGLGRLLTDACIARARRDGADAIALHTSPIMKVALAMYLRLGFVLLRNAPPVFGVPYRIYLKRL